MRIGPLRAEQIRDVLDDDPVGAAAGQRLHDLIEALDAPLGIGEGTLLFQAGRGGQHHVGQPAGGGEEDVLHHEEFQLLQRVLDLVDVGLDQVDLLAEDVHRLHLALLDALDHLVVIEPLFRGELDLPGRLELRDDLALGEFLVAGQLLGRAAVVSRALHVVVSAERIGARPRSHVIARDEQQVGNCRGGIGAHRVLRHAHGPEDADGLRRHDHLRELLQRLERDFARLDRVLHREWLQALSIIVEAVHPLLDECLVLKAVIQDVAGHGVNPDEVGARPRMDEEVGAFRHLVSAKIDDDELVPLQLVRGLHAGGEHRVALRRVRRDRQDQLGLGDVLDGAGIAAESHGARQALGGGRLAIARAIIDVVRPDHRPRELLHQVIFLVRALGGGDEGEGVRAVVASNLLEPPRHQGEGFVPCRLAEFVAFADQRRGQPVGGIDVTPAELPLDAGGNAVDRPGERLDFQDIASPGPDVEAAPDPAIGADRLGPLRPRFAHGRLGLGHGQQGLEAGVRLHRLDEVDHAIEELAGHGRHVPGIPDHRLFHQRIARADGNAVPARHAARVADRLSAVPQHARELVLPADGKRLVHLHVLARLDASAAKDALVRVVAVERIRFVHRIRFRLEGQVLVLQVQHVGAVVDRAVAVVVVADGAVEQMIGEDVVIGLLLRRNGLGRLGLHLHPGGDGGGAGADQLAIDLHHAGVARLDRAELIVVTHVRDLRLRADEIIREPFVELRFRQLVIHDKCDHKGRGTVRPIRGFVQKFPVREDAYLTVGALHRPQGV